MSRIIQKWSWDLTLGCLGKELAGTGVSPSSWKEGLHLNSVYRRTSALHSLTGGATNFHSIHGLQVPGSWLSSNSWHLNPDWQPSSLDVSLRSSIQVYFLRRYGSWVRTRALTHCMSNSLALALVHLSMGLWEDRGTLPLVPDSWFLCFPNKSCSLVLTVWCCRIYPKACCTTFLQQIWVRDAGGMERVWMESAIFWERV